MVPMEVMVPFALLVLTSKLTDSYEQIYIKEALEETREDANDRRFSHQKQIRRAYCLKSNASTSIFGNIVFKTVRHV